MASYEDVLRARRRAQAQVVNENPRGMSYLPDGTPITDEQLQDHLASIPGVTPQGPQGDTSPDQFGVPPMPASRIVGRAPGDGMPSVPQAAPAGFTPAPPPGYATADAIINGPNLGDIRRASGTPFAPQTGGSGYGDMIASMGALANSLYRMGQPGIRDRSGDLDPLTNLPAQLQQRRLNEQRLAANDFELQQQQALQARLPEIQAQLANLPPELRIAAEAAARRGDGRALASIMHTAATMRAGRVAGVPSGYRMNASGSLEFIPGGPADPNSIGAKAAARAAAANKPLTESQANAGLYADRMIDSGGTLDTLMSQGISAWNRIMDVAGGIGNYGKTAEAQQFSQAERDFINATLRRESGAAISEGEFVNARKQYIPQPGDSPEVLAQKARNRAIATHGIARAGGEHYYNEYRDKYGDPRETKAAAPTAQPSKQQPQQQMPSTSDYEAEMRRRGLIK